MNLTKARKGDAILCVTTYGKRTKLCVMQDFVMSHLPLYYKMHYSKALLTEKKYKIYSRGFVAIEVFKQNNL